MLVRATIQNFQSHKKTVLELHKGINIITGPSDAGKSAIRRALWWNFTNRPVGTSFVSDWNKNDKGFPVEPTSVLLEFDDTSVERVRKGSEADNNQYKIGGLALGAIGKDALPPPEVLKAWNINEANFSGQHDPPFLLSIPPGQVAEYLNRSVHLELIDEALSRADVDKRALNKDLKAAEADCKAYLDQVNELRWVDKAKGLYDAWAAKSEEYGRLQKEHLELEDLLGRLEAVQKERREKEAFLAAVEPLMARLEPLMVERREQATSYNELLDLVEALEATGKDIRAKAKVLELAQPLIDALEEKLAAAEDLRSEADGLESLLTRIADVRKKIKALPDVEAASAIIEKGQALVDEYQELARERKALSGLLDELEDVQKLIKSKASELLDAQQDLIEALDGKCPVCGGEYHGEENHG